MALWLLLVGSRAYMERASSQMASLVPSMVPGSPVRMFVLVETFEYTARLPTCSGGDGSPGKDQSSPAP